MALIIIQMILKFRKNILEQELNNSQEKIKLIKKHGGVAY